MKRPGLWAGLCCIVPGILFWAGMLVYATPSTPEDLPELRGIPTEFLTFSCCESKIDFKKEKDKHIATQRATTDVVDGKRTLDIYLNFALTWECNAKADEPRHCVGRFTTNVTGHPQNTSGAGPQVSSITITRVTEQHECPKEGPAKKVNGVFGIHYSATYPDASPINGTLELTLTLEPQSKGNIKHKFRLPVKTKAGKAVDLGPASLEPIR